MPEPLLTRYLTPLLAGRRAECFDVIQQAVDRGVAAEELLCEIVWPAMAQVERLYREDRINTAAEHMAALINRTVVDQLQARLPRVPTRGRRVLVTCADAEHEEIGAQMLADLFQADGWETYFVGGGVPADEILALVGQLRPNVMLVFGAHPDAVPQARSQIELIREVGVRPAMNILVTGGIFNRADGLWAEVGADVFCDNPRSVLRTANEMGPRQPNAPRPAGVKRRRRRRKATTEAQPALATA